MIDFSGRSMQLSLKTKAKLQMCPFCGMGHPMYVNGYVRDYNTGQIITHPYKGYSFCNCKNIWYTDWANINQDEYAEFECTKTTNDISKINKSYVFNKVIRKLNNFKSNIKSFLNIGGGSLFIEDLIKKELGWETTAVDINKTLEPSDHRLIHGDIEDRETLDKLDKYDVIWTSHVLEHLKDPLKTIQNLKDKLKPGGLFYITLPDPFFFDPNKPEGFSHWWTNQHHIMFNMDNLSEDLSSMGFLVKFLQHEPNVIAKEFHILATLPTENEIKFIELSKDKKELNIPIELIAPDDQGHNINNIDKEHRDGAEEVKKLIKEGLPILPIACNYYGKRTDGFKRYIAYKELGYKTIPIIINNMEGCQHKQSWVM